MITGNIYSPEIFNYFQDKVLKVIEVPCWIAGGCLRSAFGKNDQTKDIDIFFDDRYFYDVGMDLLKNKGFHIIHESENSITLKKDEDVFDLVKIIYQNPVKCIENFDFVCCCCYLNKDGIASHHNFLPNVREKKLNFNKIKPNKDEILRRLKIYLRKGYTISGELIKLYNNTFGTSLGLDLFKHEREKELKGSGDSIKEQILVEDYTIT